MKNRTQRGFALLLVLSLLGLLILSVYALSALTRVDGQLTGTATYQNQARQNALTGLRVAIGQLQQYASSDTSYTGTADISLGVSSVNSRWTVAWATATSSPRWLVSGEPNATTYAPTFSFVGTDRKIVSASADDIVLVNNGSTNTTASRYNPGDGVIVPRVALPLHDADGRIYRSGDFAYWVGDEGTKLSAALPGINPPGAPASSGHQIPGLPNSWTPTSTSDLAKALSYEQFVSNAGAGPTTIKNTFHGLTLVHLGYLDYPSQRSGLINVNTAGGRLWQGVAATYNPSASTTTNRNFATAMGRTAVWGSSGADKITNGPFTTVAGFLDFNPEVLVAISDLSADLNGFKNTLRPWLTVRSDTFRVRAYGDALNPVPEAGQSVGRTEAVAWCEAIVQRVKNSAAPNDGHFVITYFRWLGPDDI